MNSSITLNDVSISVHDAKTDKLLRCIPLNKEGLKRIEDAINDMIEFDSIQDMLGEVAWKGYEASGSPDGKVDQDDPHIDVFVNWSTVVKEGK